MRYLPIVLLAATLGACQSAPPPARPVAIETAPRIEMPVTDKADVTYMARYMLPGPMQSAQAVYSGLSNTPTGGLSPTGGNIVGAGVAGAMGQSPVSRVGAPTALYASTASQIFFGFAGAKSPANVVGRVYLPRAIDGKTLASAEEAREFVREDVRRRIDDYAAQTGRTVSCFDQCDSFYPTYRLTKTGSQTWPYYDPAELYVTFFIHKPTNMERKGNEVLDKIVHFTNAWEGGYFLALNNAPPAGGHTTKDGESVPEFQDTSAFAHPLERTLLRVLTKGGNYAVGNQYWRQFAWNGRVFALGEKLDLESLIQYEIAPSTDRP
ncbi:MAG: hypothetical protein F8N36_14215 [Desulfovibrio sp.]|uniref:hypothetical protein n=1 Tax=Desulfovibrio sp. TaxID=885 RepID=UPI00135E5C37|nr:hypothetical protein [Desulfovibrio sp.]MTJ93993.1 hypothetical protein [Desulfovibrio sp.]